MKTVRQSGSLIGCVLLLVFASSAFAETSGITRVYKASGKRVDRKMCYALIGSGIPQPCDRFAGPIATTVSPIDIYGRRPSR